MERGFIKIYRKIKDEACYKRSAYIHLWLHLLIGANHKSKEFMWNGDAIIVKEGQLITGRKQLSQETGIPEGTIEDILKYLERQHQIQQQKTTKYRIITIINWSIYQNSNNESNNRATTEQQQADTNKNYNNYNNYKNDKKKEEIAPIGATPSSKAKEFFTLKEQQEQIVKSLMDKGASESIARQEVAKFIGYWTETNKSGTKQRWEGEKYFDIARRLGTWFKNYENFKGKGQSNKKVYNI